MPDFDITVPHISRVYDYWLGGKDNFAADREIGGGRGGLSEHRRLGAREPGLPIPVASGS